MLTRELEMVKAYRDTWTLGVHSYLSYLRHRLILCRELLADSGSIFVQISDENLHLLRSVVDEVFRPHNFVSLIGFKKTSGATAVYLPATCDYLLWYAKNRDAMKYRTVLRERAPGGQGGEAYTGYEEDIGRRRRLTDQDLDGTTRAKGRVFRLQVVTSQRLGRPSGPGTAMHFPVPFRDREYVPLGTRGWTTTLEGMNRLTRADRIESSGDTINYVRYHDDFPVFPLTNLWEDTQSGSGMEKIFVVQTNAAIVERCLFMTTDPGDLVLDPTCGSGTTGYVAEQWGRRWITVDTSRVALALARQRLLRTRAQII